MKWVLYTLTGLLISLPTFASVVVCDRLLAASYIIDLGDEGSMGDVVGESEKPAVPEESLEKSDDSHRRPELELPLQEVPVEEKRPNKAPPPPVRPVNTDLPPLQPPLKKNYVN